VKAVGQTGQAVVGPIIVPRMRILIIDDDPVLLKSLCDTLEKDGHVVTPANGGQEGIDAFRSAHTGHKRFDVVITDLGMPYVDGSRVSSAVKALSSTTPVILLTGWGQRLRAEGDVPSHVDCVLNKPPKLREVREALAKYCRPERPEAGPSGLVSRN
jgi:CheY-like chemotaxis protein